MPIGFRLRSLRQLRGMTVGGMPDDIGFGG